MTRTRIAPKNDLDATSIELSTIDIDRALERGRRLRAEAFISVLKSLFNGRRTEREARAERGHRNSGFSPDCAASA
jgi:hypothetical protein